MNLPASFYELKHSYIKQHDDGKYWVYRDRNTRDSFSDSIICRAYPIPVNMTKEEMNELDFIHYCTLEGVEFYIRGI